MIKTMIVSAVVLAASSVSCAAGALEALPGTWETMPENCGIEAPSSGEQVSFNRTLNGMSLTYLNHATEGGVCELPYIFHDGDIVAIGGECGWEEAPVDTPAIFVGVLKNGRLTLMSEWMGGTLQLHPCTPEALDLMGY